MNYNLLWDSLARFDVGTFSGPQGPVVSVDIIPSASGVYDPATGLSEPIRYGAIRAIMYRVRKSRIDNVNVLASDHNFFVLGADVPGNYQPKPDDTIVTNGARYTVQTAHPIGNRVAWIMHARP